MTALKKRGAPASSAAPPKKKIHLESGTSTHTTKAKRAVPVVQHESESESENEDGDEDGDEDLDRGELENADDQQHTKVSNTARESHKAQRALLEQRRAARPHASLLNDAKRTWALARQKNATKGERQKHIAALMDIIRGKVQDIVFKHDASRIVQTVVKRGDERTRNEIAAELKGRYCDLAQNKYSKFLVTKIARLCPAFRPTIISEFKGRIYRLLLHREASRVLADIYELYANAYERSLLVRDLYGRETALFASIDASNSEEDKARARLGLKSVLQNLDAEKTARVLSSVKENLDGIFNNPDKGSIRHAIAHRALWEYLSAIGDLPDELEREKLRREAFEACQDLVAEMVHTKDGSRAVREFLCQGTAKDRKQIIKAIKPYVETMAKDDEAQLVLFTALDVTDDTKLLSKSLVSPIIESAPQLRESAAGRRALLYLLLPRARRHFTPALTATLAETDPARERTSRKDPGTRIAEIRAAASPEMLAWITRDGPTVTRETAGSLLVLDIMFEAEGDKSSAIDALLKSLTAPYPSGDPAAPHPVDLSHTARMYKKLLQGGHYEHSTKAVERAERFSAQVFAEAFVRVVGRDSTLAIARGDGAYVVAALLERLSEEGGDAVRREVREWFEGFSLSAEGTRGTKLLMERTVAL